MLERPNRLVLDLAHVGDELRATVTQLGPTLSPIQTWASRSIDLSRARALYASILEVLNRANRWGSMDHGSRDLLRQRGQLLFDEVLPARIKELLRNLGDSHLTVVMDESLVFVPWELMHTGTDFVGLRWEIGRVVRTPQRVIGAARPVPEGVWRMLVVCDPRGDLMGSYYEGVALRDELDTRRDHLAVDLRSSVVGTSDAKELIREYDLIHYAGHAEVDSTDSDKSGWLLTDGILNPSDILGLAGGDNFPRLVFANACRSGQLDGDAMVVAGQGEATFSVANAFLLAGVRHYVGTLWDVPDEPACQFALAFYDHLVAGGTLGEAMRAARKKLCQQYGDDTVLWASYVLYGDPAVPCFAKSVPTIVKTGRIKQPNLKAANSPPHQAPQRRAATTRIRGAMPATAAIEGIDIEPSVTLWPWLAVVLAAGVALWLATRPTTNQPRLLSGPVLTMAAPEAYPAPRDKPAETPSATPAAKVAAGAPVSPPPVVRASSGPEFVIHAQRADGDGVFHAKDIANGATLHSWDNFQLRVRLDSPGWVGIWHIESKGQISRIHPAGDQLKWVDHVGWIELPDRESWFYLDERAGLERFVLGVTKEPVDLAKLKGDLAPLAQLLERSRKPRATHPPLTFRGLGGTRTGPKTTAPDEATILRSIDRIFAEAFDHIKTAEFNHQ